ncbi:MAG TPA: iron-containing alcohol dehydrogenase [Parvibaculum sp.]
MAQAGSYAYVPIERVSWGAPAAQAAAAEAERLDASRVMIVASGTLSRKTDAIAEIKAALGARFAGLFDECREHTPLESVIACTEAARAMKPDLILTVGGGTPIDTVKIVQLCLAHDIRTVGDLLKIANKPNAASSPLRQIVVPTTLSGGEYSSFAGGMDKARNTKDGYLGPDLCAQSVILDPAITLHTPEWLWFSTAIRAVDHAVEGYCAPTTNAFVQAGALHALKLFAISLRRTKKDPADLDARTRSQMAVWLAASGLGRVPMGASHGIGYVLGAVGGVPHGYTSCVMLPAVLRWNEPATSAQQRDIAAALGMPEAPAWEAVALLLDDLGLPRRLADVGIQASQLPLIAERALQSPVVKGNPRPVRAVEDVMEVLAFAS